MLEQKEMIEYEFHAARLGAAAHREETDAGPAAGNGKWAANSETERDAGPPPLRIGENEGWTWVNLDQRSGELKRAKPRKGLAAFHPLADRNRRTRMALLTPSGGAMSNGLPSLSFSVLTLMDLVRLGPEWGHFLLEKYTPHVGRPTKEMLGKKCPFEGIPLTEDSWVASCRCGAVYHFETEETHPGLQEKERLNCFNKARKCGGCGRVLTTTPFLTEDPREL